ncbi:hypothetical protein, partial [Pseudonocardia nigra]|uniref:hypothetical protein n=1 Tax=Pseudonocardia nigra TaxID=1921578 RepID=UPI001C5E1F4C
PGRHPPTPASAQLVDDVRGLLGAAADELRAAQRTAEEAGPQELAGHRAALEELGRRLEQMQGQLA